jgi:mRNA-degrading endonuclease RelE of RelBE toxin-antitoxin system
VKSVTSARFRKAFSELPDRIQRQARQAFRQFQQNPNHPSLGFKQVHPSRPIYSVRIGLGFRAIGIRENNEIIWFWIGSHADYDRLLSQM